MIFFIYNPRRFYERNIFTLENYEYSKSKLNFNFKGR